MILKAKHPHFFSLWLASPLVENWGMRNGGLWRWRINLTIQIANGQKLESNTRRGILLPEDGESPCRHDTLTKG